MVNLSMLFYEDDYAMLLIYIHVDIYILQKGFKLTLPHVHLIVSFQFLYYDSDFRNLIT